MDILSVEVYLDDNVPECMDGIIRIASVISYKNNGEDEKHPDLVDNTEFYNENEVKNFVKDRLNIETTEIIEIIY